MVIERINEKAQKFDAAGINNTVLSAHVHINVPEKSRLGSAASGVGRGRRGSRGIGTARAAEGEYLLTSLALRSILADIYGKSNLGVKLDLTMSFQ